jgi:hypothetical protein
MVRTMCHCNAGGEGGGYTRPGALCSESTPRAAQSDCTSVLRPPQGPRDESQGCMERSTRVHR